MGGFNRFLTVSKRKSSSTTTPTLSRTTSNVEASGHSSGHGEVKRRKPLPWLESPLNPDALSLFGNKQHRKSMSSFHPDDVHAPKLYKTRHEASTIELYYDLFFVGNLASFTAMHVHVDAESLKNYIGFFTMLWFTWLSTTLFDVRFNTDSILDRAFKIVHFSVMAAFTFCGPIFDSIEKSDDIRAVQNFAIVMCVSRAALAIQYAIVALQSIKFSKAMIPLALTALIHLVAAAAFIATRFVFEANKVEKTVLIVWYVISVVEALGTMTISLFFRMINFRHSHLIERVGLLTLIVMGEGVLGMTKSILCVTKGQSGNNSNEIGTIVASIILLYLVWTLYFDQIDHHRFGEVRQHIWALLHFPLHVALLLTVEGSTALIVWNTSVQGLEWVKKMRPADIKNPAAGFANVGDFIKNLNASMWKMDKKFTSYKFSENYNFTKDISSISNISAPYQSSDWNSQASKIVDKLYDYASKFVFQAHKDTYEKMVRVVPKTNTDSDAAVNYMFEVFDTIVIWFYVASGAFLLLLAVLFWFGKTHKGKSELGEILGRVVVGFALVIIGTVGVLTQGNADNFTYKASGLLIPIVVIAFFIVVVWDQVLLALAARNDRKKSKYSDVFSDTPLHEDHSENISLVETYSKGGVNVETTEFPNYSDHRDLDSMPPQTQPYDAVFESGSTPPPAQYIKSPPLTEQASEQQQYEKPYHGRTRSGGYSRLDEQD